MSVKLLTEQHLEFLSLIVDCTDLSESTHVKMPHCWKSHVTAHIIINESSSRKKIILMHLNYMYKGAYAHRSVISTFIIRYLESVNAKLDAC